MRRLVQFGFLFGALLFVAGCATQPLPVAGATAPGFFAGALHGLISPVTLIVSFFSSDTRMYAYPNAGQIYDAGFFIGVAVLSGGVGTSAH